MTEGHGDAQPHLFTGNLLSVTGLLSTLNVSQWSLPSISFHDCFRFLLKE